MGAEEGGPVSAPTVVEANVLERTRHRREYGARLSGTEITVSFRPSSLKQQEQTKPEFWGGSHSILTARRREPRDWSRKFFFFFVFFSFSYKRILCFAVVCYPLSPQR